MSIVTWTPPNWGDATASEAADLIVTAMAYSEPRCLFCGEHMERGQKAWVWHGAAELHVVAHTQCLANHASGILADIATVVRK